MFEQKFNANFWAFDSSTITSKVNFLFLLWKYPQNSFVRCLCLDFSVQQMLCLILKRMWLPANWVFQSVQRNHWPVIIAFWKRFGQQSKEKQFVKFQLLPPHNGINWMPAKNKSIFVNTNRKGWANWNSEIVFVCSNFWIFNPISDIRMNSNPKNCSIQLNHL